MATEPTKAHSDMAPSSLYRRLNCPASLKMEAGKPDDPSDYSKRGDDLHDMLRRVLGARLLGRDMEATEGELALMEIEDQEAINACAQCATNSLVDLVNPYILIEERIDLPLGLGFGTPDLVLAQQFERGEVFDWKFGWQPVSRCVENMQLMAYVIGVQEMYGCTSMGATIVQPARKSIEHYDFTPEDLEAGRQRIAGIVEAANDPAATPNAGEWCRWCKARVECPAGRENAQAIVKAAGSVEQAANLPPDQIGNLLVLCQRVEPIIGAIKSRAYALLSQGIEVPHAQLVPGRASRSWSDDTTAERRLLENIKDFGKRADDIYEPQKLKSPAQIEKVIGKRKEAQVLVEQLTTRTPGNLKLEIV